ncbi:MAG TPA: hypothetical protein PKN99_05565 [Cyclobacteriaceae bacterium]|nr:hypothetical protein [Cyclobacteriaceae bacterium]HRK54568.1 hypothetical protein [Cyclobacteriaceae bacterium]
MKTLSIILISFFSISANLFAANPDPIAVVETSQQDHFVMKVDKDLFGGEVLVTYSTGEVVTTMTIKRKKMVIDFDKVKFGSYTIKVVKDGVEINEFNFNKELILSQVIR